MAVTLKVSCTQNSQSIENNSSNITVKVTASWTSGSYNKNSQPGYVKIDGTRYDFKSSFNTSKTTTGSKTLYTKTVDVEHDNATGEKTVSYNAFYETNVSSGDITASGSKTLDTIARGATVSSAPNFTDEENPSITYSNPAGDSVDKLEACIKDSEGKEIYVPYREISKTGTSYTFALTDSERKALRIAATENTLTVGFYLRTTIGETILINHINKTLTITNAKPTIDPVVEDVNEVTLALTGDKNKFVKYFSNAAYNINATPKKEATIKTIKVVCGNKNSSLASGTLYGVESETFVFQAVDSRGNSIEQTVTKTLIPYVKLTCNIGDNRLNALGETTVECSGNCYNGSFGNVNNAETLLAFYQYKIVGEEWGTDWLSMNVTLNANSYKASVDLTGLDYTKAYVFRTKVVDAIYTEGIISTERTVRSTTVFDFSDKDFNFNVPVSIQGDLTVSDTITATDATVSNNLDVTNKLTVGTSITINGEKVPIKSHRQAVDISELPADCTYTCYYYPVLGMCFLRLYFTGQALTANEPADIGFITNATYRPGNQHALATYALQDYEYSEKARIGSNGWITIIPTCAKAADDDTYITGWWFIKEE